MGIAAITEHPSSSAQAAKLSDKKVSAGRAEEAEREKETAKPESPRYDRYIHSEEQEDGEPEAIYGGEEGRKKPKSADDPDSKDKKCTVNTDKVDAEIKELKEEQKKIQEQLKQAGGDPEKRAELEKKLSGIEAELGEKDNDTYRKQHAAYSFS